jgi:hypothetical protein
MLYCGEKLVIMLLSWRDSSRKEIDAEEVKEQKERKKKEVVLNNINRTHSINEYKSR